MKTNAVLSLAFSAVLLALLACGPSLATPTSPGQPPSATAESVSPTITPEPLATIVAIDAAWSEYRNARLGFSIRIPNTAYTGTGDCVWVEDASDHSYRPVVAPVPVTVFEDVDRVYITLAEFAELTLPTEEAVDGGYRTFFAGCERITNTLERVRAQDPTNGTWEIVVRSIASDADLEALIDEVYGEACHLGGATDSGVPGMLRVQVEGDGLPPGESACWLNYMYEFFYDPALSRAATWATGQSVYFAADPVTYTPYDPEMIASFRFLP